MKKAIAIILSIMLVLAITLPAAAVSSIGVKSIKLNNSKITLKVGQTSDLKVTFTPANASQTKLTYVTSNKNVATVNTAGKITGVHAGNTTITVLTLNKKVFAKCNVTISQAVKVKFTIAVCDPNYQKVLSDCYLPAQEYIKKNPDVTIEFMGNTMEEHQKKMVVMAQSNSLPEIFWETFGDMPKMVKSNVLTDITSNINNDADFKNSFISGTLNNMTFNGKIYGVPQKTDVMGFFYNKAIFDKVGIKIPETWNELLNAVKVLNKNGITPFAQGTKDAWAVWGYYLFFDRYGWDELRQNFLDKKEKFNNPNMIKAFTRIQELANAGAFPKNITTIDYTQMKEMFLGGKAAIYTTGSWQIADIQNSPIAKDVDFNWGPLFSDGVGEQKVGLKENSTGLWVGAKAKNDPEKFKHVIGYLKYRASTEGTKIVVEQANMLPATKYAGDASSLGTTFNLIVKKLNDEYAARTEMPVTTMTSSINTVIWNAITGVMNGLMTPEQACKSLDDWNETR